MVVAAGSIRSSVSLQRQQKRIIYAAPMSIFNIQETTVMAMICSIDKDKLIIYWQCRISLGNQ